MAIINFYYMKKYNFTFILFLCTIISTSGICQKTEKEKSDELMFLHNQKVLNIVFDYEGMVVGDKTEAEYVKGKTAEKNAQKAGKGDLWYKNWEDDKHSRFAPLFIKQINKYLSTRQLKFVQDTIVKYTLIVKTLNINPGERVTNLPAHADFEFSFIESANPGVVLCKLKVKEVKGLASMASYDKGERYEESYSLAGKILAKYLIDHGL